MSAMLAAQDLVREFSVDAGMFRPRQTLHAVNGVDLAVQRGDVLGIVGESGCGKSTLARMLLGLTPPTRGTILLDGQDIRTMDRRSVSRRVQPVFQDPYSSLNPRRMVADIVAFPLDVHGLGTQAERRRQVMDMLERVGLSTRHANSTPGQLSGGQRQRVAIARALVMRPDIVVCDEPTSALDVSVQAQILNLLLDLREQFNLTYVFISHNLAVVEHIATHVAVMYLGRVVEYNRTHTLFGQPRHPYTQALLASVLTPETGLGIPDIGLGLSFPDPINPPPGCTFHPRCAQRMACCDQQAPAVTQDGEALVSCHLYSQTLEQGLVS
ncbi:ATP-binding cassette domain-containing protein [Allopusillimonas soli]|uniref:ATP-binding cassette domain-containing protein n=1 Tax=Allopusillimonas soli TaxID=659016 RepID=A0A853FBZ6_9BURK|nr:oligopeptide/dipeptide ABC transporter ATP-binding protein [Allopusillimonas soli]NYT37162.1 ATP-binding cassette domain-containing protein [Allopusillimonas soli]TEA75584.1 ATP-binding cassette domain-containing protein [Allopusillimonas soli]